MSAPEMDSLSNFEIPDFSTEDLVPDIPKVGSPKTDKAKTAQGYLYILDLDDSTVKLVNTDFAEKAKAVKSDQITPKIKQIIDLSKKKFGAAIVEKKEEETAIHSKNKELEEYHRKGFKFIFLKINHKGELVEKKLKDRNIKHYSLSEEEHERILKIGLSAFQSLNRQIEERGKKSKSEKEKGVIFFQNTKATILKGHKDQQFLEGKILSERENERRNEEVRKEKIEIEIQNKEERTKKKDDFLNEKSKRQVKNLERKAEIRQEDVNKVIKPKPPKPGKGEK